MSTSHGAWKVMAVFAWAWTGAVRGADQVWLDSSGDNTWSTNAPNWDAGAAWVNGNSAVFSGGGGTLAGEAVDIAAAVSAANITFQTNGYSVADTNADGNLTFLGGAGVIAVPNGGDTATVSAPVGGAGFTKTGNGVLQLAGANTFTGVVRVAAGTLRLSKFVPAALGATGAGSETIVDSGATLDINGAFTDNLNRAESILLSGSGVNGLGALVNTGRGCMNSGFSGITTLLGDTTIGCMNRIDFRNNVAGNGFTLTKSGASELAVGVAVTNCRVVINAGNYTYMNNLALGGADFDTYMNGGAIRSYGSYTLTERLICNGGSFITAGSTADTLFKIAGRVTLNSNVTATVEGSLALELSGYFEGAGGITRTGGGYVYVTGDTNTYSGPTIVNGGATLWVGKTNAFSGLLGIGVVTNGGTLNGYSSLITKGSIVNNGTLNCYTGLLCSGSVANNGNLYFDRRDAVTLTNVFTGGGTIFERFNPFLTFSGSASTNGGFRSGDGVLTLTNNAFFRFTGEMQIADRFVYSPDPTNVTAVVNVTDGCTLMAQAITFGNGNSVTGGGMTGVLNQTGGTVYTTGRDGGGEGNGIRLAHYPQAACVYNMMGGTLIVGTNADLGCATDGSGWFKMTGGQVFTTRVMLNERDSTGGFGRLSVSGGVLNVGTTDPSVAAISNAITADITAPYLVEFGGAGGTVRAVTNLYLPLNTTLAGSGTNAITFDSQANTVFLSGRLTGAGGLNKAGAGDLALSGTNTFSGPTRILEGTVSPAAAYALSTNSVVEFGVKADGSAGMLRLPSGFSLAAYTVGAANPESLDSGRNYTVASWTGTLAARFGASALPKPWYVYYNWSAGTVQLRAAVGTVMFLK